jgi:putative Holliday junction resolvase
MSNKQTTRPHFLALDFGLARTGVATCDAEIKVIFPQKALASDQNLLAEILKLIKKLNVTEVIIGLPTHLRGAESDQTYLTRQFTKKLAAYLQRELVNPPEIHLVDERLTSKEAKDQIRAAQLRGFSKELDSVAAGGVLERWVGAENGE